MKQAVLEVQLLHQPLLGLEQWIRTNLVSESFESTVGCPCRATQGTFKHNLGRCIGVQCVATAHRTALLPIDAPSAPPMAQPVPTRVKQRLSIAVVMQVINNQTFAGAVSAALQRGLRHAS